MDAATITPVTRKTQIEEVIIAGDYPAVRKGLGLPPNSKLVDRVTVSRVNLLKKGNENEKWRPHVVWVDTSDLTRKIQDFGPEEIAERVAKEKARRYLAGDVAATVIGIMHVVSVELDSGTRVLLTEDDHCPPDISGKPGKVHVGACLLRMVSTGKRTRPFFREVAIPMDVRETSFRFGGFDMKKLKKLLKFDSRNCAGIPARNAFSTNLTSLIDMPDRERVYNFLAEETERIWECALGHLEPEE
ncbi:MAG: hypothetical protein HGA31_04185 [Candidatus Moranbacteria bacterium]|nr:hypothetical protein [Candidatus Moranbacteria bacterium]